jgi:chemotaxis protein MotB
MKLDEGLSYEKLSLDITPLIDIVFLLVLFFAVSTSFISGEDLEALKSNLLSLSDDKSSMETELAAANIRLGQLDLNIVSLEQLKDTQSLKIRMLEAKVADETMRNEQLETRAAASGSELDEANSRYDQVYSELLDERTLRSKQEQVVFELEDLLAEKKEEVLELGLNLSAEKLAGEKRDDELASTQTVVNDLQVELDKYKKIAELDREQIDGVLRAQQDLESDLGAYLQNRQLGIKREKQRITLQLSDKILFDSGSPELKPEGAALLREVGNAIKARLGALRIQIGGHTDNIPISGKNSPWPSNWALSAARAVNVVLLLEDDVGIAPDLLSAVGHGEHRPISDNTTAEGRSRNRRIEMVLVPR